MQNGTQSERVERYLTELEGALSDRAPAERVEIVASVREHIEAALSGEEVTDTDVDRVLGSLGDPLAIAAEAGEREPPVAASRAARLSGSWVPGVVVLLVLLSAAALIFYLPVFSLIVGLVMLWVSALWTPGEKVAGTMLLPAPGVALMVLGLMSWGSSAQTCHSDSSSDEVVCSGGSTGVGNLVGTGALIIAVAAGIVAAYVLYRRGMGRVGESR